MAKNKSVIINLSEGPAKLINNNLIILEVNIYCSSSNCCCGNCMPNSYGNDHSKDIEFDRNDIINMAQAMKITSNELKQK